MARREDGEKRDKLQREIFDLLFCPTTEELERLLAVLIIAHHMASQGSGGIPLNSEDLPRA